MIKNIKWLFISSAVVLSSCTGDEPDTTGVEQEVVVSAGTADFSKYVALGNSLTAGFSDGALFKAGQENAYTKLLADQFATVGGGEFKIPYMNDNVGGLLFGGMANPAFGPRLIFNGVGPVPLPGGVPTTETFSVLPGPFNNMGVPGAKSFHLLAPGYGNPAGLATGTANPYFVRFASNPATSVLADAMAQNPTFFSLWIGNNDVLGYATSGGDGTNPITPVSGAVGVGFEATYQTLVNTLVSNGAKGVVANIPDVSAIAHFRTVPYNPLSPTNPSFGPMIPTLNATFAQLNQAFAFLGVPERSISFNTNGNSPTVIHDESLTNIAPQLAQVLMGAGLPAPTAMLYANQFGQARQATPADLFVLPASSVIGTVNTQYYAALVAQGVPAAQAGQLAINGITYPLQDKWVLLPSEQEDIRVATVAFNGVIKAAADQAGLAFVDINAIMERLSLGGVLFDNFHMSSTFVRGGAFSLDGIHLTARANAYVANEFMKSIETTYGASFKKYKANDFPLIYPPTLQ